MVEEKSPRELEHLLGNALQEKVALQYLLAQAAEQLEGHARRIADADERAAALRQAERFRRAAQA